MFSEKEDLSEKELNVVNKVLQPQSLHKSDPNPRCSLKAVKCLPRDGNLRIFLKESKKWQINESVKLCLLERMICWRRRTTPHPSQGDQG